MNQNGKSVDLLDQTWRVCSRKILSVSARTHCNLIPPLMNTFPPSKQINQRTVSFFIKGINNCSDFVKYFFIHCLQDQSSVMFKNLKKIAYDLNLTINSLLNLNKSKIKENLKIKNGWQK